MIAFFDSGYGGLTVLKPVMDLLPEYDYLYLGDNARAPYGNHSEESIKKFSEQAVNYLFGQGVSLIIFACNTASSVALRFIQEKYLKGSKEEDRKVLGVLIPVAQEAMRRTGNNRVGVIGTKATINSKVYEKEISKLNPEVKVYSRACPLLVPFIEENWHHKPEAISILKKYLKPLKSCNIDTLILGCTHYPLMQKEIKKTMKNVNILQSGEITAKSLRDYLERHPEIESKLSKNKSRKFLTTDDPKSFKEFTEKHFGMKIALPEKVSLS
ncbi:MAG: glutamate racemase [bacterium]|nr:glutamate racemase [bacterium]